MRYTLKEVGPKVWEMVPQEPEENRWWEGSEFKAADGIHEKQAVETVHRPVGRHFQTSHALKRLGHDLQEVMANPLPNVAAYPSAHDMFEWHCNIRAPEDSRFAGIVFHLWIMFPEAYPRRAPRVSLKTYLRHPNVFGSWICLDMLEDTWIGYVGETRKDLYTGWSSCYTALSVLMQLQSFLMDGAHADDESVAASKASSGAFSCTRCGHCAAQPFPEFPKVLAPPTQASGSPAPSAPAKPAPPAVAVTPVRAPATGTKKSQLKPLDAHVTPAAGSAAESVPGPTATAASPTREVGDKVTATVCSVGAAGAAVVLADGTEGTIRAGDLSKVVWKADGSMSVVADGGLRVGQVINVWVKGEDTKTGKPLLSLRQVQARRGTDTLPAARSPSGGASVDKSDMPAQGVTVTGTVVTVREYGYFMDIGAPRHGLLHISECLKGGFHRSLSAGDRLTVVVKSVDTTAGKLSLTIPSAAVVDQLMAHPRELSALTVGERVKCVVQRVNRFGAFVELGAGEQGLLPIAHIKTALRERVFWELREVMSPGMELELSIASVNEERGQIGLEIPPDCIDELMARLPPVVIDESQRPRAFMKACELQAALEGCLLTPGSEAALAHQERVASELRCFHTKATMLADALGVGVNIEYYPQSTRVAYLHANMDWLCYTAFESLGVRTGVWKEPFTHWIPVYLCPAHGDRPLVRKLFSQQLVSILKPADNAFTPSMALDVFPRLMNTLVVSVMSGDVHASVRALDGYTAFAHCLLACLEWYPCLQTEVDRRLAVFLEGGERGRSKRQCPSLGEWLPLLLCSRNLRWEDVAETYLVECFDRNAKWILEKHPGLSNVHNELNQSLVSPTRLTKSLDATQVSMRLLLFHVTFLRLFKNGTAGSVYSPATLKAQLDSAFGRPTDAMQMLLQSQIKAILKVRTWDHVFWALGLHTPSPACLSQWLRRSMMNSARRRYHRRVGPKAVTKKKELRPTLGMDDEFEDYAAWSDDEEFNDAEEEPLPETQQGMSL